MPQGCAGALVALTTAGLGEKILERACSWSESAFALFGRSRVGWRAGGNCKSRGDGSDAKWGVDVVIIASHVGSRLVAESEGLGGGSRASVSFTSTRFP